MNHCMADISNLHEKFGDLRRTISEWPREKQLAFLRFRVAFLMEEVVECSSASIKGDADGIVDALVDLCVVAVGTMHAFGIDGTQAWEEVQAANMAKEAGANPNRPNEFGLPDLVKPLGWVAPDHGGNLGLLGEMFAPGKGV